MQPIKEIISGCSFDGLRDSQCHSLDFISRNSGYYVADVVLPLRVGGKILTGEDAESSRIDSGLNWPPEAQINLHRPVRRVPIPLAWKLLVEAHQSEVHWRISNGISCPVARILATHIHSRLKEAGFEKTEPIIAIPNDLDEFGQELLLRELISLGVGTRSNPPKLVWRPIASTLKWLNEIQSQHKNIENNDFIIAAHLGPDSIEFTPLRLRSKQFEDTQYLIPLRENLNNHKFPVNGADWIAQIISDIVDVDDYGAFWQAFTGFPEIWQMLSGKEFDSEELPRIWSQKNSWGLWNPKQRLNDQILKMQVQASPQLHKIINLSVKNAGDLAKYPNSSWQELISSHVESSVSIYHGKLRGFILTGSLASQAMAEFLFDSLKAKKEKIPHEFEFSKTPKLDTFWFPQDDIISEGACIYGTRLKLGQPTYLDTLTQLYLYANKRGAFDWIPLLKEDELEVLGGTHHKNKLPRSFELNVGSRDLQVILKKGSSTIYKKTSFIFPASPQKDTPLDIEIIMSPASGLAKLEFVPENKEFLGGRRVFLDYSSMDDTDSLPEFELGFPPVVDHSADPEDRNMVSTYCRHIFENFLNTSLGDTNYELFLENLRDHIKKPVNYRNKDGKWINARIVNKDGKPSQVENRELISSISKKINDDFLSIKLKMSRATEKRERLEKYLLQTGTWLFGGAPRSISERMSENIEKSGAKRDFIEPASRCFVQQNEFKVIYNAIYERIKSDATNNFPLYCSRALWRSLQLREFAADALERAQAILFVEKTLLIMNQCVSEKNFKQKFFQAIKLFLYLLRYRIVDKTFLLYENPKDRPLFIQTLDYLESALQYFKKQNRDKHNSAAQLLMEEVKKYMYFKGSQNIVNVLSEFDEDDEDE